ncbi:cytochrome c oxidase assembly factor 8 [Polymixia lowei]
MATKTAGCLFWRPFCPYKLRGDLLLHSLSANVSRHCSSEQATQQEKSPKRSNFRPAPDSTHDWIGPPNRLSNLRPIIYHIPENETELERRLRNLRQETEDWNQEFWAKQNVTFNEEKDTYIISQLKAKGLSERDEQGRKQKLNSEEMAVFYKSFLDSNRIRHSNYNKEWYRRNFTITLLMGRAALHRAWRTIAERRSSNKDSTPTA